MLILKSITKDPFTEYPQLLEIWSKHHAQIARNSIVNDLEGQQISDMGGMFLICKNDKVIGITGYFYYDLDKKEIGLRWHGILPSERGRGISKMVIEQVLSIALKTYGEAKYLIELVPQTKQYTYIGKYFTKLGFEVYGETEKYDWSPDIWQPMRLNINKFLKDLRLNSNNEAISNSAFTKNFNQATIDKNTTDKIGVHNNLNDANISDNVNTMGDVTDSIEIEKNNDTNNDKNANNDDNNSGNNKKSRH